MTTNAFDKNLETTLNQNEKKALRYAMNDLAKTDRLENEIYQKLKKNQFSEEIIQATITKLRERNFLNDERYIKNFIEFQSSRNKYGKNKIKQKLILKGVPKELIEPTLETINFENEETIALNLLKKKYPQGENYSKMARFLYARGFESQVIQKSLQFYIQTDQDIP